MDIDLNRLNGEQLYGAKIGDITFHCEAEFVLHNSGV